MSRVYVEPQRQQFERERDAGRSEHDILAEQQAVARRRNAAKLRREERDADLLEAYEEKADREAREARRKDPVTYWVAKLIGQDQARRDAARDLELMVLEARRDGCSWIDIGHALGMSRQAAQKHFDPGRTTRAAFRKPSRGRARMQAVRDDRL